MALVGMGMARMGMERMGMARMGMVGGIFRPVVGWLRFWNRSIRL
jgi:hypothetical protein